MSSALERLKALAAAKKAKETEDAGSSVQEQKVAADTSESPAPVPAQVQEAPTETTTVASDGNGKTETSQAQETQPLQHAPVVEAASQAQQRTEHPLIMELAQLEQELEAKVPDFRLTLRNIHQKLRQDPEIVTIMTEEEIGLVVSGLMQHANAEIVAPKAVKAARAAAKKTQISADDL